MPKTKKKRDLKKEAEAEIRRLNGDSSKLLNQLNQRVSGLLVFDEEHERDIIILCRHITRLNDKAYTIRKLLNGET